MTVSKFNCEGYPDPTTYEALTRVEAAMRSVRAFRPLVYICSPFAGEVERNIASAQRYCRFAVDSGYIPFAAHLLFPQFMDDNKPFERELALHFGNVFMSQCAEVWVFGEYISPGMAAEIKRAKWKNYRLRYFSSSCDEVTL